MNEKRYVYKNKNGEFIAIDSESGYPYTSNSVWNAEHFRSIKDAENYYENFKDSCVWELLSITIVQTNN